MPIYAYRCEGCGFQKDALQKLSDPPLVDCPQCGQPKMVKQVTAAGFALKGSGWYVTDFRDQKKPATKTADNQSGDVSAGTTGTAGATDANAAAGTVAAGAAPSTPSPAATPASTPVPTTSSASAS